MMLHFVYRSELTERQKTQIKDILEITDKDFCPPLFVRYDTLEQNLKGSNAVGNIDGYFKSLLSQSFVLAYVNTTLVGFISFKEQFENDALLEDKVFDYITTVIVLPAFRKNNIATQMFLKYFEVAMSELVVLRTWSTNTSQLKLLHNLGFIQIKCLPNHRGEGIDTIYFAKEIK